MLRIARAATAVGGSVAECGRAFAETLGGAPGAAADIVALNAAFALQVAGAQAHLPDAFEQALDVLRSGAAWQMFERAKRIAAHG